MNKFFRTTSVLSLLSVGRVAATRAQEDWYQPVISEEEKPRLAETFVYHYGVYGSSLRPEGDERTEH